MARNEIAATDELWESAERWLPTFSPEEQRAGITLLRELANGERVTIAQFARALGTTLDTANALVKDSVLCPFVHRDDADRIQGFWGLSVAPTRHQLAINGHTLWTWCAEDSLFIPELLGATAEIESRDPETDQSIRLTVSPARVEAAKPVGIVVSMGRPETWDVTSAPRIIATACHYIHFFASRHAGERWQVKHPEPETVLLSLDEAIGYGKRTNARLFGTELARCGQRPGALGVAAGPVAHS